jgi:hypothetical protein
MEDLNSHFYVAVYLLIAIAVFLSLLTITFLLKIRRELIQINGKLSTFAGPSEHEDAAEEVTALDFECYLCAKTVASSEAVWLPSGSVVCPSCSKKIDEAD